MSKLASNLEIILKSDPKLATTILQIVDKRIEQTKPGWHTIHLDGPTLHNTKMNWGWGVHWKRKRWGWHISNIHPPRGDQVDSTWTSQQIIDDAKKYIANIIGLPVKRIIDIQFPPSGRGVEGTPIIPVYCRWRVVWTLYEFKYRLS
jgi:hypothetical protein